MFFCVGLQFVLHGVQEQHDSHPTCVYTTDVYYQYTEVVSKSNQHRLKDTQVHSQVGRGYAKTRCLVQLLDCYLPKVFSFLHASTQQCPCHSFETMVHQTAGWDQQSKKVLPDLCKQVVCDIQTILFMLLLWLECLTWAYLRLFGHQSMEAMWHTVLVPKSLEVYCDCSCYFYCTCNWYGDGSIVTFIQHC